jgi:hypothetical protein
VLVHVTRKLPVAVTAIAIDDRRVGQRYMPRRRAIR